MAKVVFECDGCGVKCEGEFGRGGEAFKPRHWYQRSDESGVQMACSRPCIDKIAAKSGKTSVVLPI